MSESDVLFEQLEPRQLLAAGFTLLHEFAGGADDGAFPYGTLEQNGVFYGTAREAGDDGKGVLFSMAADGTGYTVLREFAGGADDGAFPKGSLVLSGGTLYGMTDFGGDDNKGTVFSIGTDGTGFTLLHEFAGGADDGASPEGSLALAGGTLYGMTERGGDDNKGVVFSIGTDGAGFTLLHEFAAGADDGSLPVGSPIVSGGILYGMTPKGGDDDDGVIFSIATDGSAFTLLHEFAGGVADGEAPVDSLILSGGVLYGTAELGGDNNDGVVFSIATDGSAFTLLHEFDGGLDEGDNPRGSLALHDGLLFGMTAFGGDTDDGTIFSMRTDGARYKVVHEFAGGGDDGERPYGAITVRDGILYGMTRQAGDSDKGVVFSQSLFETDLLELPDKFKKKDTWKPVSDTVPHRYWFTTNKKGKFKFKLKGLGKLASEKITVQLLDENGDVISVFVKVKKLKSLIKLDELAAGTYAIDLTTLSATLAAYKANLSYKAGGWYHQPRAKPWESEGSTVEP